jgi:cell division protein FtsA
MDKSKANPSNLLAALDLGSAKFTLLVAEAVAPDAFKVVGHGESTARGMSKGVVTNMEEVVAALKKTVEEAEIMSGVKLRSAFVGVSGAHLEGAASHGAVKIQGDEVSAREIELVEENAKAVPIAAGKEILHVLAQQYKIDGQSEICNPLGMSGVRLEEDVHIITASVNALADLDKCVRRSGLAPVKMTMAALASGRAVLTPDERKLGACIADIGAGATDFAVFYGGAVGDGGALRASGVIPIAGSQIDNDIAKMFHASMAGAEEIKRRHGGVSFDAAEMPETVAIADAGGGERDLSMETLAQTIEARANELLEALGERVREFAQSERLAAGIVLTGGGARLRGLRDLAARKLSAPARVAGPRYRGELADVLSGPEFSAAMGLLDYALKAAGSGGGRGRWRRMRDWLAENF